jgi:hypothetical protein
MFKRLTLAAGVVIALLAPGHAAGPQKFATEDSATKFCKQGNVVWFNPDSKVYFSPGSQFYGKTKQGGYTCRSDAEKDGFRASKGH